MLFNSYIFIALFLPVVFFGFFGIGKYSHELASLWLASASLFFYGWWDVRFVGLLLGSIIFNYGVGYLIGLSVAHQQASKPKILLVMAITSNLILLGYFKYANFFTANINHLAGTSLSINEIILPLGISFFTFTQIAFLVDAYQGKVKEYNFVHYLLFVSYFPHLIAGPILHHKEMMPQFAKRNVSHIDWDNIVVGLTIFVLGLAKKVLIADSLADFSAPVFDAVTAGGKPMLFEAWVGALAYSLQLYFDFSAYSDMAIGLSLMFNVRLPINFNSPYKATSIIEFWRCWHMTLSRFLRDYLYIPLGGSRNGKGQRYLNLLITMLLGGLWHGAGWTFLVWGGLHGFYLMVNHAWRGFKQRMCWSDGGKLATLGAGALTFLAVVVGWVFFRADSLTSAHIMLLGMAGFNGVSLPLSLGGQFPLLTTEIYHLNVVFGGLTPNVNARLSFATIALCLVLVWLSPNVRQILATYKPTLEDIAINKTSAPPQDLLINILAWRPTTYHALGYALIFSLCLLAMIKGDDSPFLYFQF